MICYKINLVFDKMEETFQSNTLDWSSLVFFFFFLIFLYRLPACRDFSIISQPISEKFGLLIVLDETNRLNIFFKSMGPGVGIRRGPNVLLCFIIGKTLYTVRRDKNFT